MPAPTCAPAPPRPRSRRAGRSGARSRRERARPAPPPLPSCRPPARGPREPSPHGPDHEIEAQPRNVRSQPAAYVEPHGPVKQRQPHPGSDQRLRAEDPVGRARLPRVHEEDRTDPAGQRGDVELGRPERLADQCAVVEPPNGVQTAQTEGRLGQQRVRCDPRLGPERGPRLSAVVPPPPSTSALSAHRVPPVWASRAPPPPNVPSVIGGLAGKVPSPPRTSFTLDVAIAASDRSRSTRAERVSSHPTPTDVSNDADPPVTRA